MEALASRTAIVRRIGKAVMAGQACVLADHFAAGRQTRVKSKELSSAYHDGDPVVVREIQRAARFLGLGLAGLMNVIGPEAVIVGGGVVEALGNDYLDLVRNAARPHILADPDGPDRIVLAALGDDSGVLGASLMAREALAAHRLASA
jgi:glucokinase